jgi:hypothetical protein
MPAFQSNAGFFLPPSISDRHAGHAPYPMRRLISTHTGLLLSYRQQLGVAIRRERVVWMPGAITFSRTPRVETAFTVGLPVASIQTAGMQTRRAAHAGRPCAACR